MKNYLQLITTIILLLVLFNTMKSVHSLSKSTERLKTTNDELLSKKRESENLKKAINQAKSEGYIEKIAIEKLNMTKPNETILIIPLSTAPIEPKSISNKHQQAMSSLEKWTKFLNLEIVYFKITGKYLW